MRAAWVVVMAVASPVQAEPYVRIEGEVGALYARNLNAPDSAETTFDSVRGLGIALALAGGFALNDRVAVFAELAYTRVSGKMAGEQGPLDGDASVRTSILGLGAGVALRVRPTVSGFASIDITKVWFEQSGGGDPTTITSSLSPFASVGASFRSRPGQLGLGFGGRLLVGVMRDTGYSEFTAPTFALLVGVNATYH